MRALARTFGSIINLRLIGTGYVHASGLAADVGGVACRRQSVSFLCWLEANIQAARHVCWGVNEALADATAELEVCAETAEASAEAAMVVKKRILKKLLLLIL